MLVKRNKRNSKIVFTIVFVIIFYYMLRVTTLVSNNGGNWSLDYFTIALNELSVLVDGKNVENEVTKKITKIVPIKTILDGEVKTVGHQYTVEISSIVETDAEFKASGRDYRELSGTLQLEIAENASRDIKVTQ